MAKGWSKELKEEEQLAGDESDSDGMGGLQKGIPNKGSTYMKLLSR